MAKEARSLGVGAVVGGSTEINDFCDITAVASVNGAPAKDLAEYSDTDTKEYENAGNNDKMMSLVLKARGGDAEAFGDLYTTVWQDLYRYAYYYLGNREDAEDAVQEAAAEAYKGIGKLKHAQAFKSWIFTITVVCCKRRVSTLIRQREQAQLDDFPSLCSDEELASDVEMALEMRKAILSLKPEEKTVVLLAVVGGYKSHEIAEVLHMSGGGVRSKLSRALKKLKDNKEISQFIDEEV